MKAAVSPRVKTTNHVKLPKAKSNISNESAESNTSINLESLLGFELPFDALYSLEKRLRSGSFATVWIAKHRLREEVFAVKVIDRKKLKPKDDKNVYREVEVMKNLHGCEGIIGLIDFFELPETFHVILELAKGGDVFDRLSKRTVYNEAVARDLARNLLRGMQCIHNKGYAHRDLKPENLLLVDEYDDTSLKIADFGFAKKVEGKGLTTRCGTPAFVAPEIVLGIRYNEKADMWSVGAIIFFLLAGYPPFQANNHKELFRKIRSADYVFHEKYWSKISLQAKQFISLLLTVDPHERLNTTQSLKHDWLKVHDKVLEENNLQQSITGIKSFCARRKLKAAAIAVSYAISANFWNSQFVSFAQLSEISPSSGGVSSKERASKLFKNNFMLGNKIKGGTFSTVWEATCVETHKKFAVKIVSRKNLTQNDDAQVLNEVAILKSLNHPSIVKLVDFFEERDKFYLVMELLNGGDVFDRIVERNHYTEKDARDLAKTLLEGVDYLHSRNVVHRDLKPQNLLLTSPDNDADVKIADFGFSKRVHTPHSLVTRCGTPTYVAPEILKNHPHDTSADMWSIGVIIFVLLVGYPPFMEENQRTLFRKVRMGEYEFHEEDWKGISKEARLLIHDLLIVDPSCRATAKQALRNKWIGGDSNELIRRNLNGSLSELKKSLKYVRDDF